MKAYVLSGGAAKGAYQVGVMLRTIKELGDDPAIFVGTSIGNINGAYLAQAPVNQLDQLKEHLDQLHDIWLKIDNDQVYRSWFLGKVAALWKPSILNSEPTRDLIREHLNPEALASSGRLFRNASVSWKTGQVRVATEASANIHEEVYASASFPCFFLPAEIDGELVTDGGIREIAPLGTAIKLGATDITVIITSRPEVPDSWGTDGKTTWQYALRMIDIMSTEILLNDIRICGLKNELAELGKPYRKVGIRLIQPSVGLTDNSLDFDSTKIRNMIDQGYADAVALT